MAFGEGFFTSCSQFFFQRNVLAAKEIILGDNIFLLPTLRVDNLQRLLFGRDFSQVHFFLKCPWPRPEAYGWTFCSDL